MQRDSSSNEMNGRNGYLEHVDISTLFIDRSYSELSRVRLIKQPFSKYEYELSICTTLDKISYRRIITQWWNYFTQQLPVPIY